MLTENKVSIAIPAKNEEATIRHVIEQCKKYGTDVFVVDGHSTDRTCEIAEELCCPVIKDKGRGKGDGIRSALTHAKEDIVVFIDADGSHEPKDIPKLVKPTFKME